MTKRSRLYRPRIFSGILRPLDDMSNCSWLRHYDTVHNRPRPVTLRAVEAALIKGLGHKIEFKLLKKITR